MARMVAVAVLATMTGFAATAQAAQYLVVGNDEKIAFSDGKPVLSLPGKDTVSIVDISVPTKPRIVVNLSLENSIIGPPTNLAITPDGKLALLASSIDVVKSGDALKNVPDNRLYVIDLTVSPPALIATLQLGKQPSGMAINRAGNLAIVTNRAENTVSVLSISGKTVTVVGTVTVAPAGAPAQQPSAVAITPDGKHALVAKALANKVALLDINGSQVTYTGYDMITGLFPYNVQITADGRFGLVNHDGNSGLADGQANMMGVIDMTLDPPREVDQVVVADGAEGLAVSPTGDYAVSLGTNGSAHSVPDNAFFHHDYSVAVLLRREGKTMRKLGETKVGQLAEGIAFSPDGKYVYITDWTKQELDVFRIAGDKLVPTGTPLKLPGHPASLRGSTP
jgi:DNA-binding beta-propeller fold protein YncE